MAVGKVSQWKSLEQWSGTVFLIAGVLLFVTTVTNALEAFMVTSRQESILLSLEGITGFGGLVLSFVGLVGLYPRLADEISGLARVGMVFVTLPAIFFLLLLVCSTLATFLGLPSPTDVIPSPGLVTGVVFLLFAVGITLFGVIDLRVNLSSPIVGIPLLVLAAAWFVQLGTIAVFGFPIPERVVFVTTGTMAMALLVIGYLLRTESAPADRAQQTSESAV